MKGPGASLVLALVGTVLGGCSQSGEAEELANRLESELDLPAGTSLDSYHRHYAVMERDEAYEYLGIKPQVDTRYLVGLYLAGEQPGISAHGDWLEMPRADHACYQLVPLGDDDEFLVDPKWDCGAPPATLPTSDGKPA